MLTKPSGLRLGRRGAAEGRSAPDTPAWPATIEVLEKHGIKPMNPELRRKDGCFVIGCGK